VEYKIINKTSEVFAIYLKLPKLGTKLDVAPGNFALISWNLAADHPESLLVSPMPLISCSINRIVIDACLKD
jgi:hypothetical protein